LVTWFRYFLGRPGYLFGDVITTWLGTWFRYFLGRPGYFRYFRKGLFGGTDTLVVYGKCAFFAWFEADTVVQLQVTLAPHALVQRIRLLSKALAPNPKDPVLLAQRTSVNVPRWAGLPAISAMH
jgi:hypothetical protein